jgi:hypothetical protein
MTTARHRHRATSVLGAAVLLAAVSACSSAREGQGQVSDSPTPTASPSPSLPSSAVSSPSDVPDPPSSSSSPSPTPSSAPPPRPVTQLPRGGRTIFPRYRIVTYYGASGIPILGVLGSASPEAIAAQVAATAAQYAPAGRIVLPAFELITTMAQPCRADFPLCTSAIPPATVQAYLDAAHRHRMMLILDIQPGRGEFLPQVQALRPFLSDPSVGIALDPEWKLGPNQYPIQNIGFSSAASINAVGAYLSGIVRSENLPDKLLLVHQFLLSELPDRQNIAVYPRVETLLHADGFGPPSAKVGVYQQLAFRSPPYRTGFKLFFTRDSSLMSAAQVMSLRPQPDLVSYQ